MPANVALADEFAIQVSKYRGDGSGTITRLLNGQEVPLPSNAEAGTPVTLIVRPDEGCLLASSEDQLLFEDRELGYERVDNQEDGTSTITFTMPECPVSLIPYFVDTSPIHIWVNDTLVTTRNCDDVLGDGGPEGNGSVKYDVASKTLTLKNANITKRTSLSSDPVHHYPVAGIGSAGIFSPHPLTIALEGKNTVSSEPDAGICVVGDSDTSQGLTITGGGKLTVKNARQTGIVAFQNLSINLSKGGVINATARDVFSKGIRSDTGTISIAGSGTMTAQGRESGIAASNGVSIIGGTVTAKGSDSACPINVFGESAASNALQVGPALEVTTPAGGWVEDKQVLYNHEGIQTPQVAKGTVKIEPKPTVTVEFGEDHADFVGSRYQTPGVTRIPAPGSRTRAQVPAATTP